MHRRGNRHYATVLPLSHVLPHLALPRLSHRRVRRRCSHEYETIRLLRTLIRKRGEPEEVRGFAMSYGGLGNFLGDVIGGAIAVAIQQLSARYLHARVGH